MKRLLLLLFLASASYLHAQAVSGTYEIAPKANVVGGHGVLMADELTLIKPNDPLKLPVGFIPRIDSVRACGVNHGLAWLSVQNLNYGCVDGNTPYYEIGTTTVNGCTGSAQGNMTYVDHYVTLTVNVTFSYHKEYGGCVPDILYGFASVTTP